jgi:peptidylprolyl isomerase
MKKVIGVFALAAMLFAKEAIFETSEGNISVELRPDIAPKAVENFVTHAKSGYYNTTIFHRVIEGFMIQGGDPTGTGFGGASIWGKPFENEFKPNVMFNSGGILAMANKGFNPSNGSQFFITVRPVPQLNGGYTIFGYVNEGFEVVKKINKVATDGKDKPKQAQRIKQIVIVD